MNLAFLASHRGSNMQHVLDACRAGLLRVRPCVVISNNGDSEALARARREGIAHYHLSRPTHPEPERLDSAILGALDRHRADLVVLAGYLRRLGATDSRPIPWPRHHVHPALLPKHGGQGMYESHVHEAVLAAREKETGVTIHLVDEEYDHGAIVAQDRVAVEDGDTAATLSARDLEQEHRLLVGTLQRIVSGELALFG
jgi:phosphoribosylglycinamide formyltransferase-1